MNHEWIFGWIGDGTRQQQMNGRIYEGRKEGKKERRKEGKEGRKNKVTMKWGKNEDDQNTEGRKQDDDITEIRKELINVRGKMKLNHKTIKI